MIRENYSRKHKLLLILILNLSRACNSKERVDDFEGTFKLKGETLAFRFFHWRKSLFCSDTTLRIIFPPKSWQCLALQNTLRCDWGGSLLRFESIRNKRTDIDHESFREGAVVSAPFVKSRSFRRRSAKTRKNPIEIAI